jgi:hypothetical protein
MGSCKVNSAVPPEFLNVIRPLASIVDEDGTVDTAALDVSLG